MKSKTRRDRFATGDDLIDTVLADIASSLGGLNDTGGLKAPTRAAIGDDVLWLIPAKKSMRKLRKYWP